MVNIPRDFYRVVRPAFGSPRLWRHDCSREWKGAVNGMQRDRRNWTAEQKLQAIMPIIRGEVGLTEHARRLKVAESQLYRWRDQANAALLEAFSMNGPSSHEREWDEKVAELERLCGKQAAQIELLKKHDCCSEG